MNKLSSFELFWLMFMLYDSPYALMLLHYLAQAQGLLAAEMLILAAFLGQAVLYMAVKRAEQNLQVNAKPNLFLKMYFYLSAVIITAIFAEMLAAEFLNLTPKWATALLFLVPSVYLAFKNMRNIAYLSVLLLPLSLIGYVMLFLGNAESFSLMNVLSFAQDNARFFFSLAHILPFVMQGAVLMVLYRELAAPECAFKVSSWALWSNIFLLLGEYILSCGVFGAEESARLLFLPIELARILRIGDALLRVEVFSVWHWTIAGVLSTALFLGLAAGSVEKEAARRKIIFLALALWLVAAIFDDVTAVNFLFEIGIVVSVGAMAGLIKQKRSGRREK